MLDNITKRRIDDCRDILVGKLPDPKSQIEQITIGLIYKFMDDMDKEAIELGGKAKFFSDYSIPDSADSKKEIVIPFEKYSWDKLFDTKVTAAEMLKLYSEAIEGMEKNPNIPELFSNIFKNAYLPYRDPETLKMFLKTISEFEYTHSEKLGDAFEYLLSVMGSQGDAGQFRTPRHIIDFLVAIVNPGKTDTILDPACGTAGFLISAFKHIKEKNNNQLTPDERKKLIKNFVGYDISPDMVRMSLVNLYLHGFSEPHIFEYDTLSSEERWDESYDVILANPPFMSPKGGIRPHKKFSISSNRSEVLFVDYIAEHLNPNGKAGIIVPEGIIFQSGTAYKELRKMLVENYLYAVVSLPAGVFNPYSGVKTSILLMDKSVAKQTNNILFVKIDNDGYGLGAQRNPVKGSQLENAVQLIHEFIDAPENIVNNSIAHSVPKIEIAKTGDYNLSGERYKSNLVNESSYDFVELNEIVVSTQLGLVKSKIEQNEKRNELYPYPYIKMDAIDWNGQLDLTKVTYVNATVEEIIKSTLDDGDFIYNTRNAPNLVGKCSVYHGKSGKYLFNNNILKLKVDHTKVNPDFLNRILVSDIGKKQIQSLIAGTTSVAAIYQKQYLLIKIPLPPLSVQEEIVAEIESYQKIIDGAKMVVDNYKPKIDIDQSWKIEELVTLSTKIGDGLHGTPNYSNDGEYYFINGNNLLNSKITIKESTKRVSVEEFEKYKKTLTDRTILVSINGTLGNVSIYNNEKVVLGKSVCYINLKNDINKEFVKTYLQSSNFLDFAHKMSTGSTIQNVSLQSIRSFNIPVPSIETQEQIVSQIENEQKLVNASKDLIAIYEQKIKYRIAKVWGE